MIFSAQQILSDDQAVTATAISENVIDLGAPATPYGAAAAIPQDIGKGTKIPFTFVVTAAFATLTSLTITLEVSAAAALTTPTVLHTQTIAVADLIVGKRLTIDIVPNDANLRYLGARYTVTGSNATAGTITAGISMGSQTNV